MADRGIIASEEQHKLAAESQYACLGVTCADVGGMLSDGSPIPGFEPCVDRDASGDDSDDLSGGVIAAIVVSAVLAVALVVVSVIYLKQRQGSQPEVELKKSQAAAAGQAPGGGAHCSL